MSERWRKLELARDAVLNACAPSARARGVVVFAVLMGLAFVTLRAAEGDAFRRTAALHEADGAYVLAFGAADATTPVLIDRTSCDQLTQDARVARAGLLVNPRFETIPQLGPQVRVVDASLSLFPELDGPRVGIGSGLEFPAGTLVVAGGVASPGAIARQPAGIDVNSSVVVPLSPRIASGGECVAVLKRYSDVRAAAADLGARLVSTGGALKVSRSAVDPRDDARTFLARPSRFAGILFGLVAGALASIANASRGSEFSVYRLSGTSIVELAWIVALEQFLLAGFFVLSAAGASCVLASHLVAPGSAVLMALAAGAAWVGSASFLSMAFLTRNPITLARDH